MAGGLVTVYGMTEKLGLVSYYQEEMALKPFSESTNEEIDQEIRKIVMECYARTKELLESKRDLMKK